MARVTFLWLGMVIEDTHIDKDSGMDWHDTLVTESNDIDTHIWILADSDVLSDNEKYLLSIECCSEACTVSYSRSRCLQSKPVHLGSALSAGNVLSSLHMEMVANIVAFSITFI